MSDINYSFQPDFVECINMQPVAEVRASIMGGADLRAQWMAEYGIDTGNEVQEELQAAVKALTNREEKIQSSQQVSEPAGWIC